MTIAKKSMPIVKDNQPDWCFEILLMPSVTKVRANKDGKTRVA